MERNEFRIRLEQHGLTVNAFLDLRDSWNQLSASDRYELLKQELTDVVSKVQFDEMKEQTPES